MDGSSPHGLGRARDVTFPEFGGSAYRRSRSAGGMSGWLVVGRRAVRLVGLKSTVAVQTVLTTR